MEINNLTHTIIGCAFKVHNVLGPGSCDAQVNECGSNSVARTALRAVTKTIHRLPRYLFGDSGAALHFA